MSAVIPLELYNALEPQSIGDTLDPLPKASPLQTELRKCFFSTDDMLNYLKREHRQVIETLQTVEEITQQDRPTIEQISEMFKSGKRNKQSEPVP
ncbi:hypothetical protein [Azomonas macrocytogenes]|uniref:Uncharacterized protein n=1 Tax=Azomonas macrocytogenes TaxID=69962 RepID=A0A839T8E7_AZOMA|nr:hypothetical protein [Azomonas macrocytogenes]MBB3105368.1 hypothetical protein [Azomonas macrocytogenes]